MPDSFSIGLCGKRLTWSAEFGILEKIMGFLKGKEQRNSEEGKNERKRARNDFEKLGLHVGDSFRIHVKFIEGARQVVFREEKLNS